MARVTGIRINIILLSDAEEKRPRGRPTRRWLYDVKERHGKARMRCGGSKNIACHGESVLLGFPQGPSVRKASHDSPISKIRTAIPTVPITPISSWVSCHFTFPDAALLLTELSRLLSRIIPIKIMA